MYVGDLLVFCSASVVSKVFAALCARLPLIDGASDYIGNELEVPASDVHAHHEAYVTKTVGEASFGGCMPTMTPLTTDYTAANFDDPANADNADRPWRHQRTRIPTRKRAARVPRDAHDAVYVLCALVLLVDAAAVDVVPARRCPGAAPLSLAQSVTSAAPGAMDPRMRDSTRDSH